MFQIPKERIYEEVFDATWSRETKDKKLPRRPSRDVITACQEHIYELTEALDLDSASSKLEYKLGMEPI